MRRVAAPSGSRDILYGEAPFGWRISDDRSRLVVDVEEERIIGVAQHAYFVARLPMRDIVSLFEELGVVNRRAKPHSLAAVHAMIHRGNARPPEAGSRRRSGGSRGA